MFRSKKKEDIQPNEDAQPKEETAIAKKEEMGIQTVDPSFLEKIGLTPEQAGQVANTTGTEALGQESRRLPLLVWNIKKDRNTDQRLDDSMFFNTITGEQQKQVICSLLGIKMTRDFTQVDQATGAKTRVCRSDDMKWGIRLAGDEAVIGKKFLCEACPYRKSEKPGARKLCAQVINFAAYDLENGLVFVSRATRSSFVPFHSYLERNFFDKVKKGDRRMDLPLYLAITRLTLVEEDGRANSIYYSLLPEFVELHQDKDTVLSLLELAEQIKQKNLIQDMIESDQDESPGMEETEVAPGVKF